jgi:hypothetical protein
MYVMAVVTVCICMKTIIPSIRNIVRLDAVMITGMRMRYAVSHGIILEPRHDKTTIRIHAVRYQFLY